ncbi:elongation of very long chain fatty acids protein AAEL008004 [Musca domestica]|nr:elongation of very long chain fatty acids protein AAEL008004 [Musca domestica]
MVATILLYNFSILKVGPRFMKNRKPYKVEVYMKIYNIVQILINAMVFYEFLRYAVFAPDYSLKCEAYDPNDRRERTMKLVRPVVLYYISKNLDILDTVFFLLRKKYNQISFLHLYHHSIMIFGTYMYLSQMFASHVTSTGILNSFIHVVMYTYYLIAATKPKIDLTPWKKILTSMQLIQFVLLGIHFSLPLMFFTCRVTVFWTWVAFLQNLFMIAMFSHFYYRTYIRKPRKVQ